MSIVYSGGEYRIFGDSLCTYDSIPVATYDINFSEMAGYSLIKREDLAIKESKIYGDRYKKVTKTFNSFEVSDRNLGVILSGRKGIGKTLFAKMIADESIRRGYPVIMVNTATPGIENFIAGIKQSVTVIFDEFDKSFCSKFNEDDDYASPGGPQENLLGLFDGIDNGKKLFIITLNEFGRLSTYFKDRPGRFQYHFTISTPNYDEITEYLEDKILPEYKDTIPQITKLAIISSLNYDCLRAICFDINQGYSLDEVLEDINISSTSSCNYDVRYVCKNGTLLGFTSFNFYDEDTDVTDSIDTDRGNTRVWFTIDKSKLVYKDGNFITDSSGVSIDSVRTYTVDGECKTARFKKDSTIVCNKPEMAAYFEEFRPDYVELIPTGNRDAINRLSTSIF